MNSKTMSENGTQAGHVQKTISASYQCNADQNFEFREHLL